MSPTSTRPVVGLLKNSDVCLRRSLINPYPKQLRAYTTPTSSTRSVTYTGARYSRDNSLLTSKRFTNFAQPRRTFSASATVAHEHLDPPKPGEELHITFIDKDGQEDTFEVAEGNNLLEIAQTHDVDMEGACEGSCACSTCHIIVEDEDMFDKIPEADDDENDMLDLAFGLQETSRLGCQIKMTKDLDGLRVRLPSMTRNLQASDFSKTTGD